MFFLHVTSELKISKPFNPSTAHMWDLRCLYRCRAGVTRGSTGRSGWENGWYGWLLFQRLRLGFLQCLLGLLQLSNGKATSLWMYLESWMYFGVLSAILPAMLQYRRVAEILLLLVLLFLALPSAQKPI